MFNLSGTGIAVGNGLQNGIFPALRQGSHTEAAFELMKTQANVKKEEMLLDYEMNKEIVGWNIFSDNNSKIGGLLTQLAKS